MSIATTRGDGGETGLAGGIRVSKSSDRVEAYGTIDELISTMGFARSICADAEIGALTKAIHQTLKFALDEEGDTDEIQYVEEPGTPNPFLIYGRAGTPCRRCKTKVKSFTQGGRTTHFCPKCQSKKRKP